MDLPGIVLLRKCVNTLAQFEKYSVAKNLVKEGMLLAVLLHRNDPLLDRRLDRFNKQYNAFMAVVGRDEIEMNNRFENTLALLNRFPEGRVRDSLQDQLEMVRRTSGYDYKGASQRIDAFRRAIVSRRIVKISAYEWRFLGADEALKRMEIKLSEVRGPIRLVRETLTDVRSLRQQQPTRIQVDGLASKYKQAMIAQGLTDNAIRSHYSKLQRILSGLPNTDAKRVYIDRINKIIKKLGDDVSHIEIVKELKMIEDELTSGPRKANVIEKRGAFARLGPDDPNLRKRLVSTFDLPFDPPDMLSGSFYFSILDGPTPVGAIGAVIEGREAYIQVALLKNHRKKGLATQALRQFLPKIRTKGLRAYAVVDIRDKHGQQLFERAGFRKHDQRFQQNTYVLGSSDESVAIVYINPDVEMDPDEQDPEEVVRKWYMRKLRKSEKSAALTDNSWNRTNWWNAIYDYFVLRRGFRQIKRGKLCPRGFRLDNMSGYIIIVHWCVMPRSNKTATIAFDAKQYRGVDMNMFKELVKEEETRVRKGKKASWEPSDWHSRMIQEEAQLTSQIRRANLEQLNALGKSICNTALVLGRLKYSGGNVIFPNGKRKLLTANQAEQYYASFDRRCKSVVNRIKQLARQKTAASEISFPQSEWGSLRSRLNSGKDIYTTRISNERGKYHRGDQLSSTFGMLEVVSVQQGRGVDSHPFKNELTPAQLKQIGDNPFDLVRLTHAIKTGSLQRNYDTRALARIFIGPFVNILGKHEDFNRATLKYKAERKEWNVYPRQSMVVTIDGQSTTIPLKTMRPDIASFLLRALTIGIHKADVDALDVSGLQTQSMLAESKIDLQAIIPLHTNTKKILSEIYAKLLAGLAHEFTHIAQNRRHAPKDAVEPGQTMAYYLSPREIEAWVRSIKTEARQRKIPFEEMAAIYAEHKLANFNTLQKLKIKNAWIKYYQTQQIAKPTTTTQQAAILLGIVSLSAASIYAFLRLLKRYKPELYEKMVDLLKRLVHWKPGRKPTTATERLITQEAKLFNAQESRILLTLLKKQANKQPKTADELTVAQRKQIGDNPFDLVRLPKTAAYRNTQIFSFTDDKGDKHNYRVQDFIDLVKHKKPKTVRLDIFHLPQLTALNRARVKKANLDFPIILDPDFSTSPTIITAGIIDGMHRLAKAKMLGMKTIEAHFVNVDIEEISDVKTAAIASKVKQSFAVLYNAGFKQDVIDLTKLVKAKRWQACRVKLNEIYAKVKEHRKLLLAFLVVVTALVGTTIAILILRAHKKDQVNTPGANSTIDEELKRNPRVIIIDKSSAKSELGADFTLDTDPKSTVRIYCHKPNPYVSDSSELNCWLTGVHVTPSLRGRGYIKLLLAAACRWADERNLALQLNVQPAPGIDKTRLTQLYQQFGFVLRDGKNMFRAAKDTTASITALTHAIKTGSLQRNFDVRSEAQKVASAFVRMLKMAGDSVAPGKLFRVENNTMTYEGYRLSVPLKADVRYNLTVHQARSEGSYFPMPYGSPIIGASINWQPGPLEPQLSRIYRDVLTSVVHELTHHQQKNPPGTMMAPTTFAHDVPLHEIEARVRELITKARYEHKPFNQVVDEYIRSSDMSFTQKARIKQLLLQHFRQKYGHTRTAGPMQRGYIITYDKRLKSTKPSKQEVEWFVMGRDKTIVFYKLNDLKKWLLTSDPQSKGPADRQLVRKLLSLNDSLYWALVDFNECETTPNTSDSFWVEGAGCSPMLLKWGKLTGMPSINVGPEPDKDLPFDVYTRGSGVVLRLRVPHGESTHMPWQWHIETGLPRGIGQISSCVPDSRLSVRRDIHFDEGTYRIINYQRGKRLRLFLRGRHFFGSYEFVRVGRDWEIVKVAASFEPEDIPPRYASTNKVQSLTGEFLEQAEELERQAFGTKPDRKSHYRMYGIIQDDAVAAAVRVNLKPLDAWKSDIAFAELEKLNPEIWVSAIMTAPFAQRKGLARELYQFLQSKYDSIFSGVGPKSNRAAMDKLHKSLGFKPILTRRTTVQWYWSKTKTAALEKRAAAHNYTLGAQALDNESSGYWYYKGRQCPRTPDTHSIYETVGDSCRESAAEHASSITLGKTIYKAQGIDIRVRGKEFALQIIADKRDEGGRLAPILIVGPLPPRDWSANKFANQLISILVPFARYADNRGIHTGKIAVAADKLYALRIHPKDLVPSDKFEWATCISTILGIAFLFYLLIRLAKEYLPKLYQKLQALTRELKQRFGWQLGKPVPAEARPLIDVFVKSLNAKEGALLQKVAQEKTKTAGTISSSKHTVLTKELTKLADNCRSQTFAKDNARVIQIARAQDEDWIANKIARTRSCTHLRMTIENEILPYLEDMRVADYWGDKDKELRRKMYTDTRIETYKLSYMDSHLHREYVSRLKQFADRYKLPLPKKVLDPWIIGAHEGATGPLATAIPGSNKISINADRWNEISVANQLALIVHEGVHLLQVGAKYLMSDIVYRLSPRLEPLAAGFYETNLREKEAYVAQVVSLYRDAGGNPEVPPTKQCEFKYMMNILNNAIDAAVLREVINVQSFRRELIVMLARKAVGMPINSDLLGNVVLLGQTVDNLRKALKAYREGKAPAIAPMR